MAHGWVVTLRALGALLPRGPSDRWAADAHAAEQVVVQPQHALHRFEAEVVLQLAHHRFNRSRAGAAVF